MRVLITGAGGQVGTELVAAFGADGHHEVVGVDHATVDVADRDAVLGAITSFRPDAVVHPAAWTAVDACEGDPDRAFLVNALGTRHVAEGARRVGAPVFYVSTDYVFDGTKDAPYLEWDDASPRSVYGASKLAGERELDAGSTVIRTSWVCGFHGGNMVKTILRLAGEHDTLSLRRRPAGPPDLRRRPRRHDQAPRGRASARHLPRHQPGRGQLVRVRPRGARSPPARTPTG